MATIPLMVQPAQIESPYQAQIQNYSLRQAANQAQMAPLQLQQAQLNLKMQQQQQADDEAIRQAYAQSNGNIFQVPQLVAGKVSGKTMLQLNSEVNQLRANALKIGADQLKLNGDRAKRLGEIAGSITDEDSLRRGVTQAVTEGVLPDEQAQQILNQGWGPTTQQEIHEFQKRSLDVSKQYEMMHQELVNNQTARQNAASLLGAAANKNEYATKYNTLDPSIQGYFPSPDAYNPDSTPQQVRMVGMSPSQQTTAVQTNQKVDQQKRQDAAGLLGAATTKDQYARTWYSLDPKLAQNFPHPDEFDPNQTPNAVRQIGMNPDQQATVAATAAAHAQTAKYQNMRLFLEQQRLASENGRAAKTARDHFLEREADKHDALQKQEQDQWAVVQNVQDALKLPDGQQFYDPTTKSTIPMTMDEAARTRLQGEETKARTAASQLSAQQKQIRQRYGWGEFAPGGGAPVTPPAATPPAAAPASPPPAPAAPKVTKYTEAQVRARAKTAGVDPDQAVALARQKNLLQ